MTVRFGILGCARIAPMAIVRPAKRSPDAEIAAVGSRSLERAQKWARRHGIPRAYGSYAEVLADPEIDAVYIPLPNSLHAEWTIRSLREGKHVLCEKPLAANESEAKQMAEEAGRSGLVGMEALHYRYHPLMQRVQSIVSSGELGELREVEVELKVPILLPRDIRWQPGLAGGAAMDVGGYVVNAVRSLAPGEPNVLTASGALTRRGVDRNFEARMEFPGAVRGIVRGSILSFFSTKLEARGTRGKVNVFNPFFPQFVYRLRVTVDGASRRERVRNGTTYGRQLAAFVSAVRDGAPVLTDFEDAVRNTRVLDRIRSLVGVRTGD